MGGAYSPDVPEKAGFNLFLALNIIDSLREIEIDRGMGFAPISELAGQLKKRMLGVTDSDIEYCITNLKHGREIHYGATGEDGEIRYASKVQGAARQLSILIGGFPYRHQE